MIVSRITLKNWRNFRQVDVQIGQRVFLVGANASGKSNLLDVLRFLRDIAKREGGGLQQAMAERGGLSKVRCLAARTKPTVEIEVSLSDPLDSKPLWKYAIGIKQEARGYRRPIISHERVQKGNRMLLDRPNSADNSDPELLTQTHLEQINANSSFRDIATFLEPIRYQHLVPQIIRHPEFFAGKVVPMDPYGQTFLERLARTKEKSRDSRLKRIEKALKTIIPFLRQLRLEKDEVGVPHLEAVYKHWRAHGARQREDQFSDGTLRLIGLFWSLLDGDSMLLLEEPELSLNTEIIRRLPPLLYRVQRQTGRQVMISTHSNDLLRDKGVLPEEVLLLEPSNEGTNVSRADGIDDVMRLYREGMSIGEAVLPRTAPRQASRLIEEL